MLSKFIMPYLFLSLLLLFTLTTNAGVTAEDILGEYWKDPLFGQAATDRTVELEVLVGRVWPQSVNISSGSKVRVLVKNRTNEPHLLVFTKDLKALYQSEAYKMFVLDELYHSKKKAQQGSGHSHSGNSVGDAESIVKPLSQNPSVFVVGGDRKEVLIEFEGTGIANYSCMIESHRNNETVGSIVIE